MSKHTPGPWEADTDGLIYREPWMDEVDPNICKVNMYRDDGEANARLIATAPDLLEALKPLWTWAEMERRKHREQGDENEAAFMGKLADDAHETITRATEGE